jgi:hypothetical protein
MQRRKKQKICSSSYGEKVMVFLGGDGYDYPAVFSKVGRSQWLQQRWFALRESSNYSLFLKNVFLTALTMANFRLDALEV